MPDTFQLEIVTPEKMAVNEAAEEAQIPGLNGYLGILPGHAPLISELGVGVITYRAGGVTKNLAVAWGFAEVLQDKVTILAETAERPLHARAASDNIGSLRVLEKAGFRRVGVNRDFAPGRGEEIEETILRLD